MSAERPARLRRSGSGTPRRISRYEYGVTAGLALTLLGSALGLGAVHTYVLLPVAVVVLVTAWAAHRLAFRTSPAPRWTPFSLICFALAGYTLLQCVPLPMRVLAAIAPSNADVWQHAWDPLEKTRSWAPLSLDPGASLRDALRWTCYGATFFSARTLARARGSLTGLVLVFGAAVAVAVVTFLHEAAGATSVYGLYTPRFGVSPAHMGPLLNTNNLSGYLNLGALTGMGLLLMRRQTVPKPVIWLGLALVGAVSVRAASRAGVFALLIGVTALAFVVLKRALNEDSRKRRLSALALLGGVLVAGVVLAILGGTETIRAELFSDNLIKLRLITWIRPVLEDFPIFGIGRGAFESVFPAYRPEPGAYLVFTHVENFPLQWAAEWGIPVTLAALVGFGTQLRPRTLGLYDNTAAAGATIGLFVLLLQNLLDLGLEIPALPLAFAVVAGSLAGDRRSRAAPMEAPISRRWPPYALGGVGGALTVLVAIFGYHDVAEDREIVSREFEAMPHTGAGTAAMVRRVDGLIARHPADYYFPLIGAAAAWEARSPKTMAWISRSLERAPINGRAHLLLAETLLVRGSRRQALLELKLAARYSAETIPVDANIASRIARDFDELMIAVPEGSDGVAMLERLTLSYTTPERFEMRERLDAELAARAPSLVEPRLRLAMRRIAALATDPRSPPCEEAAPCRAYVEEAAAALDRADPTSSVGDQLRARELATREGPRAAADRLAAACARPVARADCLQLRAEFLVTDRAAPELVTVVKAYLAESCTVTATCSRAHHWAGKLWWRHGDLDLAALEFFAAAQLEPTEARWIAAADAATRAQMHVRAVQALENAQRHRASPDPAIARRIADERAASVAGQLE